VVSCTVTMSRGWRWVSARGSADQPLVPLNQLQPTYVRCPEGKEPSWLPDCYQGGTLLNIWLYFITDA
jgi:hypothetical protein